MEYYCITDVGLIREKNQDSYIAVENDYGDFLFLVADGIGGGKAGEVASGEVIKYFDFTFRQSGRFTAVEDIISFLNFHVNAVNRHVYDLSVKYTEYEGMGTTLTGFMVTALGSFVLNCGDSRVYGFSDDIMIRLTNDDTLINRLLSEGKITYEESLNHPQRHYLVRAIGVGEKVKADVHQIKDMDYLLACSDGLHGYVSDEEIKTIILDKEKSVAQKTIDLKDLSLLKGGYDNVTVVLARMKQDV
ncbi:MAG: serine/threonine-protein phosphatase [Erysipelotrichaceae bacterium]|nr:serine/threonine-protein phosphatase [Erysipelotrichaceae bacterium]